ncbi:acyl-CoA dehydratase activase-related protein [Anaerospora sp.]|uniref:acyl-CoA dehydratase activase-related protein n=1 Tax=Anaerospora sp. TaxID=1960278 RepID=UPI002897B491|nr:acyl-CoA dehydratase activase-related protein [Anaerospora sp.]
MSIRVGMPQGLLFYQYGWVWEEFFRQLGAEVIHSGATTRQTLDCGSCLDEVCLPAKVFFGHACALKEQVDFLFAPRVVSLAKGQYTCPKIIGMPDLLRANAKLPPLIDSEINLRQNRYRLMETVLAVGKAMGKSSFASLAAWGKMWLKPRQDFVTIGTSNGLRVAVIGHPYILHDRQVSMNVVDRLRRAAIEVITPEAVSPRQADFAARLLGKKIFWSGSHHLAGAAMALMTDIRPVNGLIFFTCFSCGPDALIGELLSQQAQKRNIPCMILSVDEHTAEAGFVTRLEAYTDMLERRWKQ